MALDLLKKFLKDEHAREFFITGGAGTGKTHNLKSILDYLELSETDYTVCAYTHAACKVLAKAVGKDFDPKDKNSKLRTLHSYLKKRPGLNEAASNTKAINVSIKTGDSVRVPLVIIDEFSFVGERDYLDLLEMYDPIEDNEGIVTQPATIKVIYVGDPNQLPPVQDQQTIMPSGDYHVHLTEVHRTDKPGLLAVMLKLQGFIEGEDLITIPSNDNFIRNSDIRKIYASSKSKSKVMLAWTNEAVQNHNAVLQDRIFPLVGDKVLGPRQTYYKVLRLLDKQHVYAIETFTGQLAVNSKFKTLEYLKTLNYVRFLELEDEAGKSSIVCTIFGSSDYNKQIALLQSSAASANKHIQLTQNTDNAASWCKNHPDSLLKKERAACWRELLAVKESVMCLDFTHAMTVHKSQGSTCEEVYIDSKDLVKCRRKNAKLFLKLFYVAVSRASNIVYTT